MGAERYDLIVIGGGINGAAIARDAAMRGMSVLLLEKGDYGCGASNKSSKMVHGGVRYLELFQFHLVKECLYERSLLLKNASNLVKPMPFIFPVYKGDIRPLWKIKLGMWLYDFLKGRDQLPKHINMSVGDIIERVPTLKQEGLEGGCFYYDAVMQDNRLVIENILSAKKAGADVRNYVKVVELIKENGKVVGVACEDSLSGQRETFFGAHVVNTTGAWSNALLEMDEGLEGFEVEPTKGVHLVIPKIDTRYALLLQSPEDRRVFFVIPWNGCSLIGTTDTPYSGNPDTIQVEEEDIRYLLASFNHYFPDKQISEKDIISTFAGLRPLVKFHGIKGKFNRDHFIYTSKAGVTTLLGGKYTTYRKMAEDVVDHVFSGQGLPCRTASEPLFKKLREVPLVSGLADDTLKHLQNTYGERMFRVIEIFQRNPKLGKRICVNDPHILAEVDYAIENEGARRLADWFYRRTSMGYSACKDGESVESVCERFVEHFGWTQNQKSDEKASILLSD